MSSDFFEGLPGEARSSYKQKMDLTVLKDCLYRFPQGAWVENPTKWPEFDFHDTYLIDTSGISIYNLYF